MSRGEAVWFDTLCSPHNSDLVWHSPPSVLRCCCAVEQPLSAVLTWMWFSFVREACYFCKIWDYTVKPGLFLTALASHTPDKTLVPADVCCGD